MPVKGLPQISLSELESQVSQGGRFVVFEYCVSALIMTFKRGSEVHYIPPGQGTFSASFPYTALSLLLGWWGIPWGFIYTPWAIIVNLGGGRDVTPQIMASIRSGPTG